MGLPRGFSDALRAADPKKLDQRIMNGGNMQRYMEEGEHDARVVGIDRNQLAQNKLTIKWANDAGAETRDMLFLTAEDKKTGATELSWRFLATLGALIPDPEAYSALLSELDNGNEAVLDLLVGLRGKLVMKRGKGYGPPQVCPEGYLVCDTQDQSGIYVGATIEEAQKAAEDAGLKKAYVNVEKYQAIADAVEANVQSFTGNLVAIRKPQANTPFRAGSAGQVIPF